MFAANLEYHKGRHANLKYHKGQLYCKELIDSKTSGQPAPWSNTRREARRLLSADCCNIREAPR